MNHTQVGIASPNPSYPQEVKTVTGENNVVVKGKNLLDTNSFTLLRSSTRTTSIVFENTLNAGTYTISWKVNNQSGLTNSTPMGWNIRDTNNNLIVTLPDIYQGVSTTYYTFTTTVDFNKIYAFINSSAGDSATITIDNIQIEKGSTALPYEPYQSQSYPINLGSLELAKISTYKNKIHNDDNDKKWYLRKYIAKVILDSTKRDGGGTTGTNAWFIRTNIFGLNDNTVALSYSNMFQPCSFNDRVNGLDITYMQNGQLNIRTANNTTIDWSDNTKRDAWLDANKPIVYYVLATPIEEEITNEALIEQLEAVKLLSGTQNNFTIDADTLPTLNLNYIGEANPHL